MFHKRLFFHQPHCYLNRFLNYYKFQQKNQVALIWILSGSPVKNLAKPWLERAVLNV